MELKSELRQNKVIVTDKKYRVENKLELVTFRTTQTRCRPLYPAVREGSRQSGELGALIHFCIHLGLRIKQVINPTQVYAKRNVVLSKKTLMSIYATFVAVLSKTY